MSLAALLAAAAAQGSSASQPAPHREYGYIAMADGAELAYVVYRPAKEGRYPVILQYDPYIAAGSNASPLVAEGYASVNVSIRGTGCSQGEYKFFDPEEVDDGVAVIDWIARQPWAEQSIGMWGYSYPAHTAYLVAARRPEHLKAIVTGSITRSVYRDALYPGGIFNAAFSARWFLHFQPTLGEMGANARIGWGDDRCAANRASHPSSTQYEEAIEHPYYDDWWKARSLETYVGDVRTPTMISQAWQDFQTQSGQDLYRAVNAPKKMFLLPGGHTAPGAQQAVREATVKWFNRWLKGEENGVEKSAPVTVLWETRTGADGRPVPAWTSEHQDWPAPEAEERAFYLSGDDRLIASPPTSAEQARPLSYSFPNGTELIANNAQFSLPVDPTGVLKYRTPALEEDLAILGHPELTLYVSSQNVDTDFMVVLHDIYPNGDIQFLQRGFLRASMRKIDPARSAPGVPYHPFDRKSLLKPGEIYEIKLALPPVGAVIRKGHSLEIAIMAPSPIGQPDWGLLPLDLPGLNTVHHSARHPSALTIPVLPGVAAKTPAPPCGSMEYQPCRAANTLDAIMTLMRPARIP